MHLFVTSWEKKWDCYHVYDERVCKHARNVLRMSVWDICFLQSPDVVGKRICIRWIYVAKSHMEGVLEEELFCTYSAPLLTVCVALPNKVTTLELICQKLTELWVARIFVWRAHRSQFKDISENKKNRLKKIILEAVEQSHNRYIPELVFGKSADLEYSSDQIFVADFSEQSLWDTHITSSSLFLLIGPEWWLTEQDYDTWKVSKERSFSLGKTVLRMETASIVASSILLSRT